MPRDKLEDILIEYFTARLNSPETSARIRIEKPKTLAKAVDIAEMLRKNTSLISKIEYHTPPTSTPFDSTIQSPPSITSIQIGEGLVHMVIKKQWTHQQVLGSNLGTLCPVTLLLNNASINYIADTGTSMSVISEDTARKVDAKISPYGKSKRTAIKNVGTVNNK